MSPRLLAVLLLATALLTATAALRGTEYDEGYTIFLASGTPRPDWPATPFRAGDVRHFFQGHAGLPQIAANLRETDVHPPLYFWAAAAWRWLAGDSLFALRFFSVLCSLAALVMVAGIARRIAVPPALTLLLLGGCYGFAYTGAIARGFALAQALTLAGTLVLLGRGGWWRCLGGGLLLGLATLSNYLAAFAAAGVLLWLLVARWRQPSQWLAAGIGFALVLPADLWFFLAQRGSRSGQFPPFEGLPSLARLAQYAAANIAGGLPLYAVPPWRLLLGGGVALLLLGLLALVAWRWPRLATPPGRWLLLAGTLAQPIGLLLLGLVFNSTPIELRYIAFALPFAVPLLAAAIASLAPPRRHAVLAVLLVVQAAALLGLLTRPETMQPQSAATRQAAAWAGDTALVLVPRGNDGVGVAGAVLHDAPDSMRLLVVPRDMPAAAIAAAVASERRVVLLLLGLDGDSRATLPALQAAFADAVCWHAAGAAAHAVVFDHGC